MKDASEMNLTDDVLGLLLVELKEMNNKIDHLVSIPSTPLELKRLAVQDSANYVFENFPQVQIMRYRHETIRYAVNKVAIDGIFLEFGVFKGETIRQISAMVPSRDVYGFDSFVGLPEDWAGSGKAKGDFNLEGKLPKVNRNVSLVSGWFEESIPKWKKQVSGDIAFCHIDCDLYSSTVTIFEELEHRFKPGTILLFDEYFGYLNWRNGEHKAFVEMIKRTGFAWEPLAISHMAFVVKLGELK